MKKTMVYISVYEKVVNGSDKFYTIISPLATCTPAPKCFIVNYGQISECFKSTKYPWGHKLFSVRNNIISRGYTLRGNYLIDFNVYLEYIRKLDVLTVLIENNITTKLRRTLAKYGRLTPRELIEANSLYFKYKNA